LLAFYVFQEDILGDDSVEMLQVVGESKLLLMGGAHKQGTGNVAI